MKRTVLITGAASGIGRAVCELFADDGWKVIGVDTKRAEDPKGRIDFLEGDVSAPESLKRIVKEVAAIVDNLDVLVNNAATQICKPIVEMEVEEWDDIMAVNVRSIYLLARNAFQLMKKPGGAIVNVGSVHSVATSVNIAAYAASKGAVLALTRAMALEFAPDGIRVNAVLPGAVDTHMLREGLKRGNPDESLMALEERTPLGRIGKPGEIAQSILFLADNTRSSFITGEALVADGGALARLSTE